MNPSLWLGLAGLVVTVFSSLLVLAFAMGRLQQRVQTLEERVQSLEEGGKGQEDFRVAFARFEGEVNGALRALGDKFDTLRADLTGLREERHRRTA